MQPIEAVSVTEVQALNKLREVLHKSSAEWSCPGQKRSVMAVLNGTADVVSIMATGSGKTMLVLLPVLLEPHLITVVIVPLKALLMDYSRRLDNFGISYELYTTSHHTSKPLQGSTNLILLTIEQARKRAFKEAITQLHRTHVVKRFVFDEVHFALTASDYRTSFKYMNELRAILPVQFVLMSGTVAPHSMDALRHSFALTENAIEIRTKTVRPELQYILEPPVTSVAHVVKRVVMHVEAYTVQFGPDDRGLIYAETKNMIAALEKATTLVRYEGGDTMTDAQRDAGFKSWIRGDCRWMACTSAFGAGLDWASVRVVLFAGTPIRLGDMVQESDRAGRDKKHAIALIIPFKTPPQLSKLPITLHTGEREMNAIIYKTNTGRTSCLRHGFTSFYDGLGTTCTDLPHAERCSRCEPIHPASSPILSSRCYVYKPPLIPSHLSIPKRHISQVETSNVFEAAHQLSKKHKAEREAHVIKAATTLEDALRQYDKTCIICEWSSTTSCGLPLPQCPNWKEGRWSDYKAWKPTVQWKKHTESTAEAPNVCWKCGVPQISDNIHGTFAKNTNSCRYEDKIVPLAFQIWNDEDERKEAEKRFGKKWSNIEAYTQWLTEISKPPLTCAAELYIWWVYVGLKEYK